jgi:hypothetical protein
MPISSRPNGVRVITSDALVVTEPSVGSSMPRRGRSARLFGPTPIPGAPSEVMGSERADLLAAFAGQEMTIVDEIELQPAAPGGAATRGAGVPPPTQTATLEVDLGANEESVVLLEQEGLYSWHFPTEKVEVAPSATRRRGLTSNKTARFALTFQRDPSPTPPKRGLIQDFLMEKARAVVLKFVAHVGVGAAIKYLERNVRRGLVAMESSDPQRWRAIENLSALPLPNERPARLLLFVHGTFSSTFGSFGPLGATPWGRAFLDATRANYDAVIGFDHATLSDDPLENANDLRQRLQLDKLPHPPRIDAISYSRGGIVLRSLLENLIPTTNPKPEIARAIFVAVVNGGTLLASPDNWRTLIDLYTNLAAATCRVVALFPQATFGALLTREIVQGVGAFAKYLATEAVTRGGIPGLAAMDPGGKFIRELNQTQPGQASAAESQFYAVLSQFDPKGASKASEIPRQLLFSLTNGLIDRLMKEANDLVVNTASMTMIDPGAGNFIKDRLDFGENGVTYHTNYFLQPQTVNALTRWLELQPPQAATPARRRRLTAVGSATPADVPARVDTDVLVLQANESVEDGKAAIEMMQPSYAVIERWHEGRMLRYAYPAEQIAQLTDSASLSQALALHEYQASPTGSMDALPATPWPAEEPTQKRFVAMTGDRVAGVMSTTVRALTTAELVAQAAQTAAPVTVTDRIVRRRGLPTFAAVAPSAPSVAVAEAAAKVNCHFQAEMDGEVELSKTATVEVTIAREEIATAARAAAAGKSDQVDPNRKLIVQLLAKGHFDPVGETRLELDVPPPGQPQSCYFDVDPTNEGDGEIWIVIRQGQVPLVNLILRPKIVGWKPKKPPRINAPAITPEAPILAEPLHQLRIFERRRGTEVSYEFIFDSPALNLNSIYDSPPIPGDRNAYVNQLYKEIENRWISNGEDAAAFNEDLRGFGADLWDQIIPPGLQTELWANRDKIRSIMVFSEEPFIPWELVHMKEPGKRLGAEPLFLAQKGLVRWLHNFGWPPQTLALRKDRRRYIAPDYPHPDYKLPQAQAEATYLARTLGATAVVPQLNDVRKLLHQGGAFDLLHFAGHGVAEHDNIANAQLMLEGWVENGNYLPAYLSATTVEQFAQLDDAQGHRPIVVINACQAGRAGYKLSGMGGFARAFLTGKAGVFVGALWSVGDQPARTFTEQFYERLLAGDQLAAGAISAREKARAAGEATWLAYVVYGHPHARIDTR